MFAVIDLLSDLLDKVNSKQFGCSILYYRIKNNFKLLLEANY